VHQTSYLLSFLRLVRICTRTAYYLSFTVKIKKSKAGDFTSLTYFWIFKERNLILYFRLFLMLEPPKTSLFAFKYLFGNKTGEVSLFSVGIENHRITEW